MVLELGIKNIALAFRSDVCEVLWAAIYFWVKSLNLDIQDSVEMAYLKREKKKERITNKW